MVFFFSGSHHPWTCGGFIGSNEMLNFFLFPLRFLFGKDFFFFCRGIFNFVIA